MIKRDYFAFFALLLAASLTLTACDSNEADDSEVEVDVTETVTETTVTTSEPAVQVISTQITSGALADVVGDNVVVDNSSGAIIQTNTTTTATSSAGGGSTTTSTSTTVAPLVNQTTGQPTGQVAVAVTQTSTGQASQVQTIVVTPNVSNAASITVPSTADTGTQTTSTLDASFEPASYSSSNTSWQNSRNVLRQRVSNAGGSFSAGQSGNGQTWGERIQAALASGKSSHVATTVSGYTIDVYVKALNAVKDATSSCSVSSAILTVNYELAGTGITLTCDEVGGWSQKVAG